MVFVAPSSSEYNRREIEKQALAALDANQTDIATNNAFVTITTPTNAQVVAQVKELTRQSTRQAREINGLIRLALGKLNGTT